MRMPSGYAYVIATVLPVVTIALISNAHICNSSLYLHVYDLSSSQDTDCMNAGDSRQSGIQAGSSEVSEAGRAAAAGAE